MRWLLLVLALVAIPAGVSAQTCPDGTLEGESPEMMPCQLCRNGALEYLPPRTTCSDDERFACNEQGVTRAECAYPNPPNGDETTCVPDVPKGPACPNGLTCDMDMGYCREFCESGADCRNGFTCEGDRCVPVPAPDMGTPPSDMGAGDMGGSADMGPAGDMSTPDMESSRDIGQDDGSSNTGPGPDAKDEGGCCAVIAGSASPEPALMMLLGMLLVWRRRA